MQTHQPRSSSSLPSRREWRFQPNPKNPAHKLTRFQRWIVQTPARNLVAVAARRSGKSVGSRCLITKTCISTPNGKVAYVAPTLNQAKRLVWDALMRDVRGPGAEHFVRSVNLAEHRIEYRNGCVFMLFGAANKNSVERLRGHGFDLVVCDEADDPFFTDALFDEIIGPALSDQLGRLVQIGSPKGRARIYREWRKGQPGDELYDPTYASIQVTAIEAGIIHPDEIERARRTRPKRAFMQEYEANFVAPHGIIYDEWNESIHVVNDNGLPDSFDEIIVGVDWGTAARGAMIVIGLDRVWVPPIGGLAGYEAARAWVLEEHTHAGMGYDDGGWWRIARGIQEDWQPKAWYADPAAGTEGYIRQLEYALQGGGRAHVAAANNEVRPGIALVREFVHHDEVLGEPARLFVLNRCETLRREFGSYRYRKHRTIEEEFVDEPVKEDDHCLDAARYALASHFGVQRGRRRKAA